MYVVNEKVTSKMYIYDIYLDKYKMKALNP